MLAPLQALGEADHETLQRAVSWCESAGARNINDITSTGLTHDFVRSLQLKMIPARKLEAAIAPSSAMPSTMMSYRSSHRSDSDSSD